MGREGKGQGTNGSDNHGIVVEGLVRQFKDVRAVDGIDLRIEPGQIYGFLGPNGAVTKRQIPGSAPCPP
jgi:ABC-type uncharacterized transport system ATPase subunit